MVVYAAVGRSAFLHIDDETKAGKQWGEMGARRRSIGREVISRGTFDGCALSRPSSSVLWVDLGRQTFAFWISGHRHAIDCAAPVRRPWCAADAVKMRCMLFAGCM